MEYIYLPVDTSGHCVEVQNSDVIRVYDDEIPELGQNVNYTDFYINNSYLDVKGTVLLDTNAICMSNDRFTTSYQYRLDFPNILIMVYIIVSVVIYIVSRCVKAFYRRAY